MFIIQLGSGKARPRKFWKWLDMMRCFEWTRILNNVIETKAGCWKPFCHEVWSKLSFLFLKAVLCISKTWKNHPFQNYPLDTSWIHESDENYWNATFSSRSVDRCCTMRTGVVVVPILPFLCEPFAEKRSIFHLPLCSLWYWSVWSSNKYRDLSRNALLCEAKRGHPDFGQWRTRAKSSY